jgi:monoamine oxidase
VGAWAAFDDVAGEPVLVGWAVGSAADALPADDAEAVAGALACLAARLGRTAPDPTWAAVARWADDPYTLGATTFVPAGADPALRVALAGMASPRLLLAGEAGATDHPGTVHGALGSGEREASRCIDLMRQAQ